MVKPYFSLTEQAIEKLAKCVHGAPIKEIKLVRLLHSVASVLDNGFSQSLKPLDINQSEWLTLLFLFSADTKYFVPSELAKSLNCSRTNATRLIESLRKREYILCVADSADRRKIQVSLSPTGRAFVEQHLPEQFDNVKKQLNDIFNEEEKEQLRFLNMKILHYFERN